MLTFIVADDRVPRDKPSNHTSTGCRIADKLNMTRWRRYVGAIVLATRNSLPRSCRPHNERRKPLSIHSSFLPLFSHSLSRWGRENSFHSGRHARPRLVWKFNSPTVRRPDRFSSRNRYTMTNRFSTINGCAIGRKFQNAGWKDFSLRKEKTKVWFFNSLN